MVLLGVLAVVLTIQGSRQATWAELQRGFDRSAALAVLMLDQDIEIIQRTTDEIMRLPPLRQAVATGNRQQVEALLLHQLQFDLQGVFDGILIRHEDAPRWVEGGFAIHRQETLLDWMADLPRTPSGLSDTQLKVMTDPDGQARLVLVLKRYFRDPDTGRELGAFLGAVVLSDRLSLFNQIRRTAGLQGFSLAVDGHLFPGTWLDHVLPPGSQSLLWEQEQFDGFIRQADSYVARRALTLTRVNDPLVMIMHVENPRNEDYILVTVMALLAGFIVLVMAGLLIFLTHYVARPLRRLAEQTRQLPVGPLRPLTMPRFHLGDELGQVVTAFNELINRVAVHQQELDRMAHYDTLTGVPNRRLLAERIARSIARARASDVPLAVCYLDLDGFKPINDRFGHAVGDRLLLLIAERLKTLLKKEDTLARLGGDEFVLLFNGLDHSEVANALFRRLLGAVADPALIDGTCMRVSASMGVTFFPADDNDPDTLIRHADQAMYMAKEAGKNRYHVFDPDQSRRHQDRMELLSAMEMALHQRQWALHYQPRVDLVSGTVVSVEALLRWHHPERGLLMPGSFMDDLIGSELEPRIGRWVIEAALSQMALWHTQGLKIGVSINISADHLLEDGFVEYLEEVLDRHPRLPRDQVECEILETATLKDLYQAGSVIARCKQLGVRFALDDFGTGYSSLAYFRSLPVDVLKIDRSFVKDMLEDPNDLDVVESIVGLAATFNKDIIAEGVENMTQAAMLIQLGCRHVQGYAIARPMVAEVLSDWMRQWHKQRPDLSGYHGQGMEGDLNIIVASRGYKCWLDKVLEQCQQTVQDPRDWEPENIANPRFVRWYNGSGSTRYGMQGTFAALWAAHVRVQDQLLILIENWQQGADDADMETARLQVRQTADQVFDCFEQLKRKGPKKRN
ncbi:diguanylate cyclase (GGDEF) domain-containing protein [Ectothiorhodospira magna]|uniref:Diguanylate cyclase (GGDEF) domain-containing protein n=1 Tax=Ectothiorhodospira magna TaxID=867345 RepID=A0A1H9E7W7_9GAMM|nr:EAL domain-containing protein [Ectothiorhodospira magna]SEQ21820.1 diguanylate cyclase (GGDEF) domain-containing protein [Ectothiorhodospira magna]